MKKILLSVSALLSVLAVDAQQRTPLFEIFTSSTCGPCNLGNSNYETIVNSHPASEYVSVKYQQDFPNPGDPYCTAETVNRRTNYLGYNINSIPRMETDGAWDGNAQLFTPAMYTAARAVPAKFNISGTYSIKNKVVSVKVKYSALAVPAGAKLYVAITERETVQNVKNNGETKFYNVVKKFLPDQMGTTVSTVTVGSKDSTSLTYTFAGAYRLPTNGLPANRVNLATEYTVENFANLNVVAWIQGSNKEVYNAANLAKIAPAAINEVSNTVGSVTVYPNPASDIVSVDLSMKEADQVSANLVSVTGAVVATKTLSCAPGQNKISFETQHLANGFYSVIVLDSRNNSFSQKLTIAH